jgi:hypothetical protein
LALLDGFATADVDALGISIAGDVDGGRWW